MIKSPHPSSGEVPKAFVVLKGEATPQQIMEFVARLVAPNKIIRQQTSNQQPLEHLLRYLVLNTSGLRITICPFSASWTANTNGRSFAFAFGGNA